MKIGVQTFILPMDDSNASQLMNDPNVRITSKEKFPCPKEGIVLFVLEYEDYRDIHGGVF